MTILEKATIAKDYYESYRNPRIINGFEKVVATDGTNTMFVNSDYEPETPETYVFKLDTRRGVTGCQLYKPRNNVHE